MKTSENKKLRRTRNNRVLGGVLAGIANYFDLDPVLVRVVYCALSIFTAAFPGIFLYILMLILIPAEPEME